jgi:hypothetical protein
MVQGPRPSLGGITAQIARVGSEAHALLYYPIYYSLRSEITIGYFVLT